MNAKKYLKQIEKIDALIFNKNIEVQQWKDIAKNTTTCMGSERVQSSGNQQKMAYAVEMYTSIENEILELMHKRAEIARTIELLPTSEYNVLHMVYFQDKDFKQIASEMDHTYSWVTTTHGRALKMLQDILNKIKTCDGVTFLQLL